MKRHRRTDAAQAAARTREALWTTIGHLLDAFSPAECRKYLENSGYAFG